jgi:hypothetical protein
MKRFLSSDKGALAVDRVPCAIGEGISLEHMHGEPFVADRKDCIFALFAFLLGFFYVRWVLFSWQGWGVTAFTIVYCLSVTMYFVKKGVSIPKPAYFWLAAVVLTGLSYSLYANRGLEPWRSLFLMCSAVYYVLYASGRLILNNTSNWLLMDGINGFFIIPFKNFGCQYKSLSLSQYLKRSLGRQILSIVLGLLLSLLVAGMIFPLLMRADSGGFFKIANKIYEYYRWIQTQFMDIIINCILAIPVAAYLFGLVSGCAHNRGCSTLKRKDAQQKFMFVQVLAPATVYTVLGSICCLYLVFIGSQLPYFFSAFVGRIPEGWQVYSEYARSGFFELCQIVAINLLLLIMANLFTKKTHGKNLILKMLNVLFSLQTLLFIATAFSKMALYIGVYGLTIRRLLPCLFMALLAVVFGGIIVLQKRRFSIVRLSAFAGTMMICALCLLNPDGFVASYNADRYLSGTLENFDVQVLYQSGPAGIDSALKVFKQTDDERLKGELKAYIYNQQQKSTEALGLSRDNLQNMHVRQKTADFTE